MTKFAKLLRKEQGLTLIELIAALSLFAIVAGIIYGVMMFGIRSYNEISAENKLRDEADLLMSAIITEMYTFAPNHVASTDQTLTLTRIENDGSTTNETISIKDGALLFNGVQDSRTSITAQLIGNSGFLLTCSNGEPCESGLIDIKLNLHRDYGGKPFQLSLESKFGF